MGNVPLSHLHQPPPRGLLAGDPQLIGAYQQGNELMTGGSYASRSRCYYSRSCKRMRPKNLVSLPDEMLFEILVRLSAEDVYELARPVCRVWYRLIHTHSFVNSHLHHATPGLLCQNTDKYDDAVFISYRCGQIELSKFGYYFNCGVWASCNGLILVYESHENCVYIVNPATKKHFVLPPLPYIFDWSSLPGMAYAVASMELKVFITVFPDKALNLKRTCYILTVGVDEDWRKLSTQNLSPAAEELMDSTPYMTEGYMHWTTPFSHQVVTLNVETEILTMAPHPLPQIFEVGSEKVFYMSTEWHLSLLIATGELFWEVWEMKPESGEWRKLPSIDMEAQKVRFEQLGYKDNGTLHPVGWLDYPQVLVLAISYDDPTCCFYNLRTHVIDSIQIPFSSTWYRFTVHKSSLVWVDA